MSMMRFGLLFRELAERETRTVRILEHRRPEHRLFLPVDEYGFDELYCVEKECDCRRVIINVLARYARRHVATINHAFDPPGEEDLVKEQTFLDPLNTQSQHSAALLNLFRDVVLADEAYRQRLVRHYRMFKDAVEDPEHPCQRLIQDSAASGGWGSGRGTIRPPPPRRGKRQRWR